MLGGSESSRVGQSIGWWNGKIQCRYAMQYNMNIMNINVSNANISALEC